MTTSTPDPTAPEAAADDLTEYRVPVTVFTTVRAVDSADAVFIAERAIRQACVTSSIHDPGRLTIQAKFDRQGKPAVPVKVHRIYETGQATRNGYLYVEPTDMAYPPEEAS